MKLKLNLKTKWTAKRHKDVGNKLKMPLRHKGLDFDTWTGSCYVMSFHSLLNSLEDQLRS